MDIDAFIFNQNAINLYRKMGYDPLMNFYSKKL